LNEWYSRLRKSSIFLIVFMSSLSRSVRNALVVVAASFVAFSWNAYGYPVFTVTGETSQGLPPFRPPPTTDTTANGTVVTFGEIVQVRMQRDVAALTATKSLLEQLTSRASPLCCVQGLGGGIALIPFMGVLESIAIAKAFGKCV